MKQDYVCGFLFDLEAKRMVLISKHKPEWQAGKLNGVGGKIDAGEEPLQAMRREFWEEAGLEILDWRLFARLEGGFGKVFFFHGHSDRLAEVRTCEEEPVVIVQLDRLDWSAVVPNLNWLIPMALHESSAHAIIEL